MSSNKGSIHYEIKQRGQKAFLTFNESELDEAQLALWKSVSYFSGLSGNNRSYNLIMPAIRDGDNGRKYVETPPYLANHRLNNDEAMHLIEQSRRLLADYNRAVKEHNALKDELDLLERQRLLKVGKVAQLEKLNEPTDDVATRAATLTENQGRYTFMLEYVSADEPTTNYTTYIRHVYELPFGSMLYQNYLRDDFHRFEFVYATSKFTVTRHDWFPPDKPGERVDFLTSAQEVMGESDEPLEWDEELGRFETIWKDRVERIEPPLSDESAE